MINIKFNLISLFFKLNFALKREIGKDTSRRVMDKMKYHYKEINKRKPKEKGIMGFHRMNLFSLVLHGKKVKLN